MKSVILAGGLGARISEETYLKLRPMIAAFRNLKGDAEASEKLARIRRGLGSR
jgi:hypothetical protein